MLVIPCRLFLVGCILAWIPCSAAPPSNPTTDVLRQGRFTLDSEGRAIDGQVVSDDTLDRSIVAILPDRTTGEDWGLPHLARAIDDLNLLRPDAVFCVGDLDLLIFLWAGFYVMMALMEQRGDQDSCCGKTL